MAQIFDGLTDTPQRQALTRINWQMSGHGFNGYSPDDGLFRGAIPGAAADRSGVYPIKGKFNISLGDAEAQISWVCDDRFDGSDEIEAIIVYSLVFFEKKYKPIVPLLGKKDLDKYLEVFKRKLFKNNCHFNTQTLGRFHYHIVEEFQLTADQAAQLWDYIETNY